MTTTTDHALDETLLEALDFEGIIPCVCGHHAAEGETPPPAEWRIVTLLHAGPTCETKWHPTFLCDECLQTFYEMSADPTLGLLCPKCGVFITVRDSWQLIGKV